MSWFNPLSWGEKVATDVLDKDNGLLSQVGGWIGGLTLTDQEVAEYNAKTVDSVQDFVKATLSESTDRSKTRRAIAVLWIKVELGIVIMACICAPWDMALAVFYLNLATSTLMLTTTTAIIIFFFGSHGIAKIKATTKK